MFLSTTESSLVGGVLRSIGVLFFGEYYRYISAPILVILGSMILVKKASWGISRFIGIILFYISLTSLVSWYDATYRATFALYGELSRLLGTSSAFLALLVGFFASLYLTLRISYRNILSKVRESVPSFSSVREAVLPDDDDDMPPKKSKMDEAYKKKAEELERKLESLQKSKTKTPEKPITGKSLLSSAFSGLTKKVPIETPDGKIIENKNKSQSVDFGSWDFPSTKLLNEIEHRSVVSPEEIEEKSLLIQKTLLQFGIDVDMEGESI